VGQAPEAPYASYLDDPLEALIGEYHLLERKQWAQAWNATGEVQLERGDILGLRELLQQAHDLGTAYSPEETRAQIVWTRLEALAQDPKTTADWLEAEGGQAAAATVEAWIGMLGVTLDRTAARDFAKLKNHREAKKFQSLVAQMEGYRSKNVDLATKWEEWAGKMDQCDQPFVAARMEALRACMASGDASAKEAALDGMRDWPAAWVTQRLLIP
ncbi:MAG TPA: hypothetical protein P5218_16890, partial [Planctomycetota bacterium]|nr:hypothetical protein [Planctomycetota bacterium]